MAMCLRWSERIMATCSPKPRAAGRKCRFYPEMSQSFWKLIGCPHGHHPFVIQRQLKQQSCEKFLQVSAGFLPCCIASHIQQEQKNNTQQAPALQHLWSVRPLQPVEAGPVAIPHWELKCFIRNLPSYMRVGNGIMWETGLVYKPHLCWFWGLFIIGFILEMKETRSSKLRHGMACLTQGRGSIRK